VVADPMEAITAARAHEELIVIAGSIFLIGAVRGRLDRDTLS
jgi:hypothetical protein